LGGIGIGDFFGGWGLIKGVVSWMAFFLVAWDGGGWRK